MGWVRRRVVGVGFPRGCCWEGVGPRGPCRGSPPRKGAMLLGWDGMCSLFRFWRCEGGGGVRLARRGDLACRWRAWDRRGTEEGVPVTSIVSRFCKSLLPR